MVIRTLVVEDSAVTRELLVYLLDEDPDIEVVGSAPDGEVAVRLAETLRPDLIVMDVHLPRLSGSQAARQVMERFPTPIVMVTASSSLVESRSAFEALRAGALTLIDKPGSPDDPMHSETASRLLETVKLMAEVKVVRRWPKRERSTAAPAPSVKSAPPLEPARTIGVVAIGASTGGPPVLAEILGGLPGDLGCPILVVQHIAADFALGFADWLGGNTRLAVKLAVPNEPARPGTVYVGADGSQLGIARTGLIQMTQEAKVDGFSPSASALFRSVAESYGRAAIGVLLTGMGRDGAAGLLELRRAGGLTIAQDEESSAVFGMPGEAVRLRAAQHVLPPAEISTMIRTLVNRRSAQ